MSLEKLPNELCLSIAEYLDLRVQAAWTRTSKRFQQLLTERLYSIVAELDQREFGYPGTLLLAFQQRRTEAFRSLLSRIEDINIPNVRLGDFTVIGHDRITGLAFRRHMPDLAPILPVLYWCHLQDPDEPDRHREMIQLVMEKGIDIRRWDDTGFTVLHFAAMGPFADIPRGLIEAGADVNACTSRGVTPLHLATEFESSGVVNALIQAGADLSAKSNSGVAPLHLAAGRGNTGIVESLIRAGADITSRTAQAYAPLAIAVFNGHPAAVDLLLQAGVPEPRELAVLVQEACVYWWDFSPAQLGILERLVQLGPDFSVEPNTETALHVATRKWSLDAVKCLVKGGCPIHQKDHNGRSALYIALSGSSDIVKYLLEQGADPSDRGVNGMTLLQVAASRGWDESVRLLLEAGADWSPQDARGETALHKAAGGGYTTSRESYDRIVQLLVQAGADLSVETSYSRTALHIAAQNGNYQAVEYLIQGGANIIAGTEEGDTALHLCVRSALRKFGRIDAYTRLIGCILLGYTDVSMSEVYGGEIARCPRDSGYMPTLRLLRKFGDPACTNRRGLTALDLLAAETPSLNWPLLEATFKEAGKVAFPEEDDYTFEAFDAGALWGTVT